MRENDETYPGGAAAKEAGCTCPIQSEENICNNRFQADKDCPLHGLHLLKAMLEEENSENYLSIDELQRNAIYEVSARNFSIALWNGEYFLGIRRKFSTTYIGREYHWDNGPPHGTVRPLRLIAFVATDKQLTEESCRGLRELLNNLPR